MDMLSPKEKGFRGGYPDHIYIVPHWAGIFTKSGPVFPVFASSFHANLVCPGQLLGTVSADKASVLDRVNVQVGITLDRKEHVLTSFVHFLQDNNLTLPPVLDRATTAGTFHIAVVIGNVVGIPVALFKLDYKGRKGICHGSLRNCG
jgi:hypothetical protein